MKKPLLTSLVIAAAIVVLLALPMAVRSEGESSLFLPVIFGNQIGLDTPEPPPQPEPPSSLQLIDDALKAGKINASTAAVYRVYALFYDTRLPVQFRGAANKDADIAVMEDLVARFPQLSAAQQTAMRPYLLRPDDDNSWAYMTTALRDSSQFPGGRTSPGVRPAAATPVPFPTRPAQSHNWEKVTAINGVIIHYQADVAGDKDKAEGLKAAIDGKIYAGLVGLMGRQWMPDGEGCDEKTGTGGSDLLDIYLVHGSGSLGLTYSCKNQKPSPSWILIDAGYPLGDETHSGMVQTTAHEMMHAVQNNFTYLTGNTSPEYIWVKEATATWVEEYLYPAAQSEQGYALNYLKFPMISLEDMREDRQYGVYLWPFYLNRVLGKDTSIVRDWFLAAETKKSLAAVASEQGEGAGAYNLFGDYFNDFAVKNWNHFPVDKYKQADGLNTSADVNTPEFQFSNVSRITPEKLELPFLERKFPHLSAQYFRLTFPDDTARSVAVYNGISRKLYLGPGSIYGDPDSVAYYTDFNDPSPDITGMKVNALVKINGVWEQRDWTFGSVAGFCRDRADERIEEMVVIITNSNWKEGQANYEFTPAGELPAVVVSPVGCYRWKGSIDVTYPNGKKVLEGRNLVLEANNTFVSPYRVWEIKGGTLRVKIHYYNEDTFQTFDADETLSLGGGKETGAIDMNNLVNAGPHPYGYMGYFQTSQRVSGTMSWLDENNQTQVAPNMFDVDVFFRLPNLTSPQAKSLTAFDRFSGEYTDPQSGVTYSWNFTLDPEP